MFVYIWEYLVAPTSQAEFEREYGPGGSWVALFARAPGYLGTSLLRDRSRPDRFLTVDRWESEEAHSEFRKAFRAEFEALDARCEVLTRSETLLGYFHSREPAHGGEE